MTPPLRRLSYVICLISLCALAEHLTSSKQNPTAARKVQPPGVRYDAARKELMALKDAPTADSLSEILKSKDPWVCNAKHQVTGNLHQIAADFLRSEKNSKSKSGYITLFEASATRALTEAASNPEALAAVALDYRFTPSGEKAALMAAMALKTKAEPVTAALLLKGLFKDNENNLCKDERTRKIALLALDTYAESGFGLEFTELKPKLLECELTDREKTAIKKYTPPTTQYEKFQQSYREFEGTEMQKERDVPTSLKLALAYGATPDDLNQLFSDRLKFTGPCPHLQWPTDPKEVVDFAKSGEAKFYANTAVPALIAAVSTVGEKEFKQVAKSLGEIGEKAVTALIAALSDKDDRVRRYAARVLGRIGDNAHSAVPELTSMLKDKNEHIQNSAANALGDIGEKAHTAVPELTSMLTGKNHLLSTTAAIALSRIGEKAHTAVPSFITMLSVEDTTLPDYAAEALVSIGEKAVPELEKFISQSKNANAVETARQVLSEI